MEGKAWDHLHTMIISGSHMPPTLAVQVLVVRCPLIVLSGRSANWFSALSSGSLSACYRKRRRHFERSLDQLLCG